MRIDQVLCAAGPVDAVTGQALAYRRLLGEWGWTGEDYAPVQAAGMPAGAVRPLHKLQAARADAVVVHYSGYAPGLEVVLRQARRSLLVSHNITPAHYFWANDPVEAVRCELARTQLGQLAPLAGALAGVSEFNAGELRALSGRDAAVIPVLFDRRGLPAPEANGGAGSLTALFVGRLVPHKRQDLVIRAFARWHGRVPEARLVLVGTPLSADFAGSLKRLADELAPGAVSFESGLSSDQLWQRYRTAGAFVCLSEHEGFCIPLLEAFHFGVPVIARAAGAVPEVVGDAGVMLEAGDRLQTVAELLSLVTGDGELRAELAARGEARLAAFHRDRTAATVRRTLEALLATGTR
jgi:glycosyltransferase involved in cell wall biosynthesis